MITLYHNRGQKSNCDTLVWLRKDYFFISKTHSLEVFELYFEELEGAKQLRKYSRQSK